MDSKTKNLLKKQAFIQRSEGFDRNILPNTYHSTLQKTPIFQISEEERKSVQIKKSEKDDELTALQKEVNSHINLCRELDEIIIKNDQLQRVGLHDELYKTQNHIIDNFIDNMSEKNQLLNIMQSNQSQHTIGFDFLEGNSLISFFFKQNSIEQQILNKVLVELEEYKKIDTKHEQEQIQLNQNLSNIHQQRNQRNIKTLILQKQSKTKSFVNSIIQEQYYSYTKKTRTYCIFYSKKQEYDQTYSPFVKVKNQKQLFFENNEAITNNNNNNENIPSNLWSSSKQKLKRINPYRCQFYKFDNIFQRKENSNLNQYQHFYQTIELYLKSTLYKQIDYIFKNYAFNSQEYQMLFEQDLIENIEKIRIVCEKERFDPNHKLIVFLSDKNRGLIGQFVRDVCSCLKNFNNQILEVNDMTLTLQKFTIKDPQCEDILECKVKNIEMMIDCLESKDIFVNGQYHLRIDIHLNNNQKRALHILMLAPLQIENNELFCKQFKAVFKREKAFKEQLGSKVESIIKNCDKYMIVTQIPEMVKLNGSQLKKIQIVQNIVNFQSLLVVKPEQ